jgi:hypothetical protein
VKERICGQGEDGSARSACRESWGATAAAGTAAVRSATWASANRSAAGRTDSGSAPDGAASPRAVRICHAAQPVNSSCVVPARTAILLFLSCPQCRHSS